MWRACKNYHQKQTEEGLWRTGEKRRHQTAHRPDGHKPLVPQHSSNIPQFFQNNQTSSVFSVLINCLKKWHSVCKCTLRRWGAGRRDFSQREWGNTGVSHIEIFHRDVTGVHITAVHHIINNKRLRLPLWNQGFLIWQPWLHPHGDMKRETWVKEASRQLSIMKNTSCKPGAVRRFLRQEALSLSMFPYLEVSLCRSGSGHVIEDKCARLNCSVLQIPFPNEPIDQKGPAVAMGHHIYSSVKCDMSVYYHKVCCWMYFDQSLSLGRVHLSGLFWQEVVLMVQQLCVQPHSESSALRAVRLRWMSGVMGQVGNESHVFQQAVLFCSHYADGK